MVSVYSRHNSQKATADRTGATGFSDDFLIKGALNYDEAMQALVDYTEEAVEINGVKLLPNSRSIEELDAGYWQGTVEYIRSTIAPSGASGGNTYSGSVSLDTEHITHAVGVRSYPADGYDADDFFGAINVRNENGIKYIEGADVSIPIQSRTIQKTYPRASVNDSFISQRDALVNWVNTSSFLGFDRGEVKFIGSNFSLSSDGYYNIDYQFSIRKNRTGLLISDISVDKIEGWEKWWAYIDDVDEKDSEGNLVIVKKPVLINTYPDHYGYGNFDIFLNGTNR